MTKKILFIHPDLGIGGAERLVVDAAVALKSKGHNVQFVTTHHDLSHCFSETKDGSFPVTVVGDWIPRNILGRFYALCAYIRMIYAAIYVVLFSKICPDVIFCDIVSACIPVLKLGQNYIVYYCHFPDQLLSKPGSKLKELYRLPLNWIEEKTTSSADIILVNSNFTLKIFNKTFKTICKEPEVLYPSINTDFFAKTKPISIESILGNDFPSQRFIFLSINRYERKKDIALAIKAFAFLKGKLSEEQWNSVQLIIAGGYDNRVVENVEYFEELTEMSKQCKVHHKVYFLKSPSDLVKVSLLNHCDCLLYTPSNEHFGIVPLEAMYSCKTVIAVNSGGPTETIVHEETGLLCSPNEKEFSSAMAKLVKSTNLVLQMGKAGGKRFEEKFSFDAFRNRLNTIIGNMSAVDKEM